MMENLRYFIKEGLRNLWSNGIMTIASVGVLSICLLLLGSSLLVSLNVNELISQIEGKNQILVSLKDTADQKTVDSIADQLKAMPNVKNVLFISKHEAFENAKKTLGEKQDLLTGMEDAYPNAYQVEVDSMKNYSATAGTIKKITGVESVSANSDIANKLTGIRKIINIVGIVTFVILGIITLFLIMNTIKVAVYIRRREINIMKFVGATDGFIRWPFVVEGVVIGILGGCIAMAVQKGVYVWMIQKLFAALNVTSLYFDHLFLYLGSGFVLAGIVLGVAGSLLSLRKYLNV